MRIVHVFRAPVGGLFRHVRDLVRGHTALGHDVGLICDTSTGGETADTMLEALRDTCRLGVTRIAMSRLPGPADLATTRKVAALLSGIQPDILHGHGAKGGLFARLCGSRCGAATLYTPHGGVLHYSWKEPRGALYLGAEKMLLARTSGLLFVCEFERHAYLAKVGGAHVPARVVHNGLWPDDFNAATPAPAARDIVFIGELRELKGVDDLLDALALLNRDREVSATIVGSGPDEARFRRKAGALGLETRVAFAGPLPAANAFHLGQVVVIPSRAEAFPYIVLEAVAASMPLVATRVGGIPEILDADCLVEARAPVELAHRIDGTLASLDAARKAARQRAEHVRENFSAARMAEKTAEFYARLLSAERATE